MRRWVRGQSPLRDEDRRTFYSEVADEEHAAMMSTTLQLVLSQVQKLVDAVVAEDQDRAADIIDDLNAVLEVSRREFGRRS